MALNEALRLQFIYESDHLARVESQELRNFSLRWPEKYLGLLPSSRARLRHRRGRGAVPLRFSDRYYASFVEDDNGIRIEFMHNPPRETTAD